MTDSKNPPILGQNKLIPPKRTSARQRAWTSMRIFQEFTEGDIEATADITRSNVRRYIRGLLYCNYLKILGKESGRSQRISANVRYRLISDTGPKCPRIREQGLTEGNNSPALFDPNTNEWHYAETQQDWVRKHG